MRKNIASAERICPQPVKSAVFCGWYFVGKSQTLSPNCRHILNPDNVVHEAICSQFLSQNDDV